MKYFPVPACNVKIPLVSVMIPATKVESAALNKVIVAYSSASPVSLSKTLPVMLAVFAGFANILKDNSIANIFSAINLMYFI